MEIKLETLYISIHAQKLNLLQSSMKKIYSLLLVIVKTGKNLSL